MELIVILLKKIGIVFYSFAALFFVFVIMFPILCFITNYIYKIFMGIMLTLVFIFLWTPCYCFIAIKHYCKLKKLQKELTQARLNNAGELTLSCYKHRIEEHKKNKPVYFFYKQKENYLCVQD